MMSIKFKRNLAKGDVQDAKLAGEPDQAEQQPPHASRNDANGLFVPDANDPIDAVTDVSVIDDVTGERQEQAASKSSLKTRLKAGFGARSKKTPQQDDAQARTEHEDVTQDLDEHARKSWLSRLGIKRGTSTEEEHAFEPPLQLFMGYLPEVTSKDAMEYAMGVAEKYATQMGLTHFHATKYGRGFLYEVQEGGSGHAYGPEIARHFNAQGPYVEDAPVSVVIPTGTRLIEVTRMREGVEVLLLPEASQARPTTWLKPRAKMTSAIPRRLGFLYAGIGILATGTLAAVLTGSFFRLQGYAEVPVRSVERIQVDDLPHRQWERVRNQLQPGERIKALRYENGSWKPAERWGNEPEKASTPSATPAAPTPEATAVPTGATSEQAPANNSTPAKP